MKHNDAVDETEINARASWPHVVYEPARAPAVAWRRLYCETQLALCRTSAELEVERRLAAATREHERELERQVTMLEDQKAAELERLSLELQRARALVTELSEQLHLVTGGEIASA